jgi:hypothetical protein
MTTISITEALVELKLLHKRIDKAIVNGCFVTHSTAGVVNDPNCEAEAKFQSVMDLIKRREKVKAGIMKSNSETIVKINSEEMTVAEAIEKKNSIGYLKSFLYQLRQQLHNNRDAVEEDNEEANRRLDELLRVTFGKEGQRKTSEIKAVTDSFWEANKSELIDPLDIQKRIDELDEYIDEFEARVDLTLAESNAKTTIDIED